MPAPKFKIQISHVSPRRQRQGTQNAYRGGFDTLTCDQGRLWVRAINPHVLESYSGYYIWLPTSLTGVRVPLPAPQVYLPH
jgi:hypothetical protein